jgi:hypothetical protein
MHQKERTGLLALKCLMALGGIKLRLPAKTEVGGLTIILTPSNSAAKPAGGFQQKTFAAKPTYGKTNTGFKNKF